MNVCLRRAALLATLIPLCLLLGQEGTRFKTDVRLVRLLVTVKDKAGALISSLQKSDFSLTENGVPQEVSVFEQQTSQPLSIALLLDTSGSTSKENHYEIASVQRFLRAVFQSGNPDDRLSLFTFNWEVRQDTDFTRSTALLERKLKGVHFEAGTTMYDALYFASQELQDRPGRHVIIVITDGGDTASGHTFHQALEAIHGADAVMYAVLVMPITNGAGRNTGGENALTTISSQTGGKLFAPAAAPELDRVFSEILRDLRTQYLIGYYPKNVPPTKERFHRVQVRTQREDLRVSTRTGYYGDAE